MTKIRSFESCMDDLLKKEDPSARSVPTGHNRTMGSSVVGSTPIRTVNRQIVGGNRRTATFISATPARWMTSWSEPTLVGTHLAPPAPTFITLYGVSLGETFILWYVHSPPPFLYRSIGSWRSAFCVNYRLYLYQSLVFQDMK